MNDSPNRILLSQLIDYAGLFPPASLPMDEAAAGYSEYRKGKYGWVLGRFVVPVSRLGEFGIAAAGLLPDRPEEPWRLSAIAGRHLDLDLETILDFNKRHNGAALIDSIEVRSAHPEEIHEASEILPECFNVFYEVPICRDLQLLLAVIRMVGARAKVRTGGITPELFPPASRLARFIQTCRAEMVAFKATAGLHHAVRGRYRLTYEETSGTATMHGFLNVFLAVALAFAGMEIRGTVRVLEEQEAQAFVFDRSGIEWRGHRLDSEDLAAARRHLGVAFGSCSFLEPISELRSLHCIE